MFIKDSFEDFLWRRKKDKDICAEFLAFKKRQELKLSGIPILEIPSEKEFKEYLRYLLSAG